MAELGPDEVRFHEEIGEIARELGIEVIGVGDLARAYGPGSRRVTPKRLPGSSKSVLAPISRVD